MFGFLKKQWTDMATQSSVTFEDIKNLHTKCENLEAKYDIMDKWIREMYAELKSSIQSKEMAIRFLLNKLPISEDELFDEYKYIRYSELPDHVRYLIDKVFNIHKQYNQWGATYLHLFSSNDTVGRPENCVGQIVEQIDKIKNTLMKEEK